MPSGLRNLGNTCFLNSVLQCVAHTPVLCDALRKCREGAHGHGEATVCLVCSMLESMTQCLGNGPPGSPNAVCSKLQSLIPNYLHGQQQDAGEFLTGVMANMCDLLTLAKRKVNPLDECTKIITEVTVKCNTCQHTSVVQEESQILQLFIEGNSIEDCIQKYNCSEMLTGENQYFCLRCQKLSDAQRCQRIFVTSKVLIIALNRFNTSLKKISDRVKYPEELVLHKEQSMNKYKLKGLLCHRGKSMSGGHYVSYTVINQQWYSISDEQVMKQSTYQAMHQQGYIFFYEQCCENAEPSIQHTQTSTPAHARRPLQLRQTRQDSLEQKEETLFCCITQDNNSKALTVAKELRHQILMRPPAQVSIKKHHPSSGDHETECSANILRGKDLSETLVKFTIPSTEHNSKKIVCLSRQNMQCLQQCPENGDSIAYWLNDEVVNGYCGLIALCKNSLKDGHTVYPINSQISSKLWHAEAVESMMSYFKRDHLFQFSYWLVPVHLGAHWAMMVVDFTKRTLWYSDSLDCCSGLSLLKKMIHYIDARHRIECSKPFLWTKWRVKLCRDYPQQMNGYDCGVFAVKAAQCIVFRKQPLYSQEDTLRFRAEMVQELMSGQLRMKISTTKESANFSHCALTQNDQQCTLKHVPKEKHALSADGQAANIRNCVPSIQASLPVCDDTAQKKHTCAPLTVAVNEPQKNTSKGTHAQGSPMKKSLPSSAKPNSTFSLTKSTKTKIMAKELMVPRENSSHANTIMAVSQKNLSSVQFAANYMRLMLASTNTGEQSIHTWLILPNLYNARSQTVISHARCLISYDITLKKHMACLWRHV